ncbi:MAG TPA: TIR domain-containing protein [Sphingomicrobium sp.]
MPQVFVSYARTDKRQVARLVSALRRAGFEPWWDDEIAPGAGWEETIELELARAGAVIVCWSAASIASENVRSEARVARGRGVLMQIFLDQCDPPLFFGERQGIDLTNWHGSIRHQQFDRLRKALRVILESPTGTAPQSAGPKKKRTAYLDRSQGLLTAASITVLALLGAGWWWQKSQTSAQPARVAVQPIEALGGSPALASIAGSLTDQIMTSLGDGHIPTLSRSDTDSLKGADADKKLKGLGVGYLLNGTVENNGGTLHARLHLDDRVRHASLWSYEETSEANDSATLNSKVARSIAGVISCAYRGLGAGGLTDTELLSRYIRVCDLFVNHDDATDFKSTFELFDDLRLIMTKAPNFAPAFSDFAKFGAYLAPLLPPDQASAIRTEAARAARRALELEPNAADAYVAKEMLLLPTDWAGREALLRKAVSVDPKWPHSNGFLGMFLTETGRMREAAVYGQRAAAADLQIDWKPFGARMACAAGQTDGPLSELRERLSNSPTDSDSRWALRWCLLESGHVRDAATMDPPADKPELVALREAAENVIATGSSVDKERARRIGSKLPTDESIARFVIPWSAAAGDVDTAFRFAETLSPGYPTTGIIDILFMPETASMRRDPRFFALAKRYGLAQFWQSTGRWPDFCGGARLNTCKAAVASQLAAR